MASLFLIVTCILVATHSAAAFPGYHGHVKPTVPSMGFEPMLAPGLAPELVPEHMSALKAPVPALRAPVPVSEQAPAPAAGADCSTVVYDLVECVPYMTIPSDGDMPTKDCCDSFLTVYKYDAQCVCVALETAPSMGFEVNYTRALSLDKACKINVPYVDCHIDMMSPIEAPSSSGSLDVTPAMVPWATSPVSVSEESKSAPALAPALVQSRGSSPRAGSPEAGEVTGSSTMSAASAVVSMLVAALCSYMLA